MEALDSSCDARFADVTADMSLSPIDANARDVRKALLRLETDAFATPVHCALSKSARKLGQAGIRRRLRGPRSHMRVGHK